MSRRLFREDYILFKTLLRAKYQDPQNTETLFKKDLDTDPDSLSANFGMGVVSKERAEHEVALGHLKTALKKSPDSPLILRNLGETYQLMGQDHEAIRIFDKALDINNNDRGSLYMQAISYQNIKDYGRSVQVLEKLVRLPPVQNQVLHDLGVSYGKMGKLGLAHYNFGLYFNKMNDREMATYHFNKAMDHSGNNHGLLDRINKELKEMNKKKNRRSNF